MERRVKLFATTERRLQVPYGTANGGRVVEISATAYLVRVFTCYHVANGYNIILIFALIDGRRVVVLYAT